MKEALEEGVREGVAAVKGKAWKRRMSSLS